MRSANCFHVYSGVSGAYVNSSLLLDCGCAGRIAMCTAVPCLIQYNQDSTDEIEMNRTLEPSAFIVMTKLIHGYINSML